MSTRKPLIKAKRLRWESEKATGEIQVVNPALRIQLSVVFGTLRITTHNGYDAFVMHEQKFEGKGKTERAKAARQKWWNRFVRSL